MIYIFLTFCYFVYGTTAKDKDISKETIENSLENFQSITQNMTETLGLPELTKITDQINRETSSIHKNSAQKMAELIWSKLEKHFIVVESLAKESNEHDENVTLCCLIETE